MQFVAVDVREATGVARAVQGSDAVVNLVGSFDDMEAVHAKGAENIAAAARQDGVRALVHVSAIGADTASPSAYGRSKGGGEEAVRAAFPTPENRGPWTVFGRGDRLTNPSAGRIRMS